MNDLTYSDMKPEVAILIVELRLLTRKLEALNERHSPDDAMRYQGYLDKTNELGAQIDLVREMLTNVKSRF